MTLAAAPLDADSDSLAARRSGGPGQAGLWITRDAASMRLERQRSGGWHRDLDAVIESHGP